MVFAPLSIQTDVKKIKMIIILFCAVDYRNCVCERRQVTGESGRREKEECKREKGKREEWDRKEATEEEEKTIIK